MDRATLDAVVEEFNDEIAGLRKQRGLLLGIKSSGGLVKQMIDQVSTQIETLQRFGARLNKLILECK
jgi:hypothetical protein